MTKRFITFMCMASLVIMAACGGGNAKSERLEETTEVKSKAQTSKSVNEEWEAIDANDEAFKHTPFLEIVKEIGGFEIGKPKNSRINSAYNFTGEGELENINTRYLLSFVCGEESIKHSYFNAYTQAVWNACKNVADNGRIFALKAGKEHDITTFIEEGMEAFMVEGEEIEYSHKWYYNLNGVIMKVDIDVEKNRNSSNERVQNTITLNVERKK